MQTQGSRQVCQYQFKKNDIVWICRQCQSDETCVLCNDCFQHSSHQGHEVYFYHSQAGGCCDCGDYGAWKPDGFCHRHGKIQSDPTSGLPPSILTNAPIIFDAICAEIRDFEIEFANRSSASPLLVMNNTSLGQINVLLHHTDYQSPTQIQLKLVQCGFPEFSAFEFCQRAAQSGSTVIRSGPFSDLKELILNMIRMGLWVSVSDVPLKAREHCLIQGLEWLEEVAQINDGLCRIICNSFSFSILTEMMGADGFQSRVFGNKLRHLFLTLMSDHTFKTSLAIAYAEAYPKLASNYSSGFGTLDASLFPLSVQFLNRPLYANDMCSKASFLSHLSAALKDTLFRPFRELDFPAAPLHEVLGSRRYLAIISDFKILYSISGYPRKFLASCHSDWFSVLRLYSYLHPQSRYISQHIESEDQKLWMNSFNVYLSIGSLFELSVKWFSSPLSLIDCSFEYHDIPDSAALSLLCSRKPSERTSGSLAMIGPLDQHSRLVLDTLDRPRWWALNQSPPSTILQTSEPSALRLIILALTECLDSQANFYQKHDYRPSEAICIDSISEPIHLMEAFPLQPTIDPRIFSFHLFLHRFLSTCLFECCKYSHHTDTLRELRFLLANVVDVLLNVQDMALMGLLWAAEIRSDLWVRNGLQISDQLLNYNDPPFSKIYKRLDLFLVQVLAEFLGAEKTWTLVSRRFQLNFFVRFQRDASAPIPDIQKFKRLSDECLLLILNIVSDLPQPPLPTGTLPTTQSLLALRRAVVHILAVAPATYTEISEALQAFPDASDLNSDVLDALVDSVGELRDCSSAQDTPKYSLRKDCWPEYDPSYPYIPFKSHQTALEFSPKLSTSRPLVLSPPLAHPFFEVSRYKLLFIPDLLRYEKDIILFSTTRLALPTNSNCMQSRASLLLLGSPDTEVSLVRTLHLMTLRLHLLGVGGNRQEDPLSYHLFEQVEMFSNFLLEEEVSPNQASSESDVLTLPSLLCAISEILELYRISPPSDKNLLYWLEWIVEHCALLSPACSDFLQSKKKHSLTTTSDSKQTKAKSKALSSLASSAKMFAAMIDSEDDSEPETNLEPHSDSTGQGNLTCIICLTGGGGLGLLTLSQKTSLLHPRSNCCVRLSDSFSAVPPEDFDLHLSTCGHAMHFDCFDAFFASSIQKSEMQGNLLIDPSKGQFQCPICTRLNNCLLPFSSQPTASQQPDCSFQALQEWLRSPSLSALPTSLTSSPMAASPCNTFLQTKDEGDLDQTHEDQEPIIESQLSFFARMQATLDSEEVDDLPLPPSPESYDRPPEFWQRFLTDLSCSSELDAAPSPWPPSADPLDPSFLSKLSESVSAISFTLCTEQNLENKTHSNAFLLSLISAVGKCVLSFDPRSLIVRNLNLSLQGCDSVEELTSFPSWIPSSQSPPLFNFPLFELLVFCACISGSESRPMLFKFFEIAFLIQLVLSRLESLLPDWVSVHHLDSPDSELSSEFSSLIEFVLDAIRIHAPSQWSELRLTEPERRAMAWRWLHFRQSVSFLNCILSGSSSSISSLTPQHLSTISFFDPQQIPILLSTFSNQFRHYFLHLAQHGPSLTHRIVFHFPTCHSFEFVQLPNYYTSLHGLMTSLCPFEYPALCMVCGSVLDAGGKGQCQAHQRLCTGDSGIFFLVQDCKVLLSFGPRSSYLPGPFCDERGERHRHYRGKPLSLDQKYLQSLSRMWAGLAVAHEVLSKRSTSTRVVRMDYY